MRHKPTGSIADLLDTISSLEELEAFAFNLRENPHNFIVKPVTPAEWSQIAQMKITMEKARGKARK